MVDGGRGGLSRRHLAYVLHIRGGKGDVTRGSEKKQRMVEGQGTEFSLPHEPTGYPSGFAWGGNLGTGMEGKLT